MNYCTPNACIVCLIALLCGGPLRVHGQGESPAVAPPLPESPAVAQPLTIVIKGIKKPTGLVLIAIYSDAKSWLGKQPALGRDIPVALDADGQMVVVFTKKIEGLVSVAVIHDENGNRDMDRNMLGIPQEPYGFSRGVRPKFGAPSFESAQVASDQPITIEVDTLL